MPQFLRDLPPAQRTALLVGIPLVALVVLVQKLRGGATATVSTDDDPAPVATGQPLPAGPISTGAVGVGDLADFLDAVVAQGDDLGEKLDKVSKQITEGETGQPAVPVGTNVSVKPTGETWRQVVQRHYGSTNPWSAVRAAPANKALITRYPSVDAKLPGGAVVFMPARNW